MWNDYLFLVGLLSAAFVVGYGLYLALNFSFPGNRKSQPEEIPISPNSGYTTDLSGLSERVHHIRQEYAAERPTMPQSFKRKLRVEHKREEIEHLAYFHHPATLENAQEEHHHPLPLLLA